MFGIGLPELLLILALALIVLGPEKLPQVAKQMAKYVVELKKMSDEFKKQLELDAIKEIRERNIWELEKEERDAQARAEGQDAPEKQEKSDLPGDTEPERKIEEVPGDQERDEPQKEKPAEKKAKEPAEKEAEKPAEKEAEEPARKETRNSVD